MIPSTTQFEMYPMGMTSTAEYHEANSDNIGSVNLAYRMLRDPDYDVPARITSLNAPVFGIDLHWLPHANGALGIAGLVKSIHPEAKVLLGGLSASYFHLELMDDPAVDFVLRGDSTKEPCRQLLQALREGTPLERVQNLVWRLPDGEVVVNPLTFVPLDLDWIDVPAYEFMLHAVFKYRSMADFLPYWNGCATPRPCCSTHEAARCRAPSAAGPHRRTRRWWPGRRQGCGRPRSWSPTPD